jgi:hypothetical protein
MRAAILALGLAAVVPACLDHACTAILIWGITVDVTDTNGNPVEATVTIRDGAYVEVIGPEDRFGTLYAGAGERPGTYDVTVMASGHRDVALANVRVEDGGCHVETEKLTVMLEPLP